MLNKTEILRRLQSEKENITQQWPIQSIALFGSASRDELVDKSDIDLLIEFNGKMGWRVVELAEQLEELLGCKVDVISRKTLNPRFWQAIQADVIEVFSV